jgi:hypothetical protein
VSPPDACLRAAATCTRRCAQEAINVLLFLGVDSHKDSLAACLVDQTGAQLTAATFLNTPDGHGDLLAWVGRSGQLTRAGIEGAANLGAGMARLLH